jgi:cold-inducible RNA-binding protein
MPASFRSRDFPSFPVPVPGSQAGCLRLASPRQTAILPSHLTVRQLPLRAHGSCPCLRAELAHTQIAQPEAIRLKNIFVGNLDFNTSEDDLRQMFQAHGQVDRVSIMTDRDTGRSRGFGFVEMSSSEEGDKAIAAINGTQLGGRTLNVNEARPKAERTGGGGRDRGGDRGGRGGGGGGGRNRW